MALALAGTGGGWRAPVVETEAMVRIGGGGAALVSGRGETWGAVCGVTCGDTWVEVWGATWGEVFVAA